MRTLLYQIAAPLMSFGNECAGRGERPSDDHPRKSAALGMLGAAAGRLRSDPWHRDLAKAIGFSVAVLRPGSRMTDYHTVASGSRKGPFETRREELEASDYTTETYRDYLVDHPYFLVALWLRDEGSGFDLGDLALALENPVFELYAGRKCCTLSLPPAPLVVDRPTLREAFRAYEWRLYPALLDRPHELHVRVYFEDHPESGLDIHGTRDRKDLLIDRSRFLFRGRREHEGTIVLFENGGNGVSNPNPT